VLPSAEDMCLSRQVGDLAWEERERECESRRNPSRDKGRASLVSMQYLDLDPDG